VADEKVMALINVDDFAPEDFRPLVRAGTARKGKRPAKEPAPSAESTEA
jgi:hypothetical protein